MALQRPAGEVPNITPNTPNTNGAVSETVLPPPLAARPVDVAADVAPLAPPPAPTSVTVRIGQLGEKVREVTVPLGSSLLDVLTRAGLGNDTHNMTIRLQGSDINANDLHNIKVAAGDMITLRQNIRGGDLS